MFTTTTKVLLLTSVFTVLLVLLHCYYSVTTVLLQVRIAAISAVVDLLMRHGLASFITSSQEELDASGSNSEVGASRCADTADSHSGIESYLDGDMTTKGATLTQTELNAQGGNSVVANLTKVTSGSVITLSPSSPRSWTSRTWS